MTGAPISARGILAAYEQRINAHDFDLLLGLIAHDATFWFSDGTHRGIADIRAAFETTWGAMGDEETYWLDRIEWIAESDAAAACTYRFNWQTGARSGSGRGTTVFARRPEGWRIVHEHLSSLP